MAGTIKVQELEFEIALTGVLDDIYDLAVRSRRDPLDRRENGFVLLDFDYQYDAGSDDVKVVVSVDGVPDVSFALCADFSNSETLMRSAEACEDLALSLRSQFDESGIAASAPARRWDD